MKIIQFLAICLFIINLNQSLAQSKVFEIKVQGETLIYRVNLPEDYDKNKRYPVMFMPGMDSKSDPYSIYMGEPPFDKNWIIVESLIYLKPLRFTQALISKLKQDYNYESLHIVGFSANSVDMFKIVAAYPEEFTSVIAMPGYANNFGADEIKRNPDAKIIFIVGSRDTSWKNMSERAYGRLKKLGAHVSLDVLPGMGHVLKKFAGAPFFTLVNKRLKL